MTACILYAKSKSAVLKDRYDGNRNGFGFCKRCWKGAKLIDGAAAPGHAFRSRPVVWIIIIGNLEANDMVGSGTGANAAGCFYSD